MLITHQIPIIENAHPCIYPRQSLRVFQMVQHVAMIQDLASSEILGDELFGNIIFFHHSYNLLLGTLWDKNSKGERKLVAYGYNEEEHVQ